MSSHEKNGDGQSKSLSQHGRNYPKIALTKGKTPKKPRIEKPVGFDIRGFRRFFKKCLCPHKHFFALRYPQNFFTLGNHFDVTHGVLGLPKHTAIVCYRTCLDKLPGPVGWQKMMWPLVVRNGKQPAR